MTVPGPPVAGQRTATSSSARPSVSQDPPTSARSVRPTPWPKLVPAGCGNACRSQRPTPAGSQRWVVLSPWLLPSGRVRRIEVVPDIAPHGLTAVTAVDIAVPAADRGAGSQISGTRVGPAEGARPTEVVPPAEVV